jgi:hypothetical protein
MASSQASASNQTLASSEALVSGPASPFERALEAFKKSLKKKDQNNFKSTTFDELEKSITGLQAKQNAKRQLRNLNRLKPFLEAIEQYGKVIEVFCNSNDIVAFVWVRNTLSPLHRITSLYTRELISL